MSARTAVLLALPPASVLRRAAEEVLQLEGALRRGHVLGGGDARDGAFVQAQLVGDLAQHERLHRDGTVREEGLLALDDGRLTRRMVSKRCWMFFTNQRASCSRAQRPGLPLAAALRARGLRVEVVDAQLGHDVRVERDRQPRPVLRTMTSGTTMLASAGENGRPGLGSQATISAWASRTSSSVGPGERPSAA
jgi:hypothetical protein